MVERTPALLPRGKAVVKQDACVHLCGSEDVGIGWTPLATPCQDGVGVGVERDCPGDGFPQNLYCLCPKTSVRALGW